MRVSSFLPVPPAPSAQRPKTKWLVAFTIAAVFALIVLWSLGKSFYHNYRLSSAAVDEFHQELDRGDFVTIYGDATDDFRRAGTRGDALKFLEMVHQKMGNSAKMSAQGFHVAWRNGRLFADQVYDTQFAQGQARESFVWVIEQDRPRLESYHIDLPNLR